MLAFSRLTAEPLTAQPTTAPPSEGSGPPTTPATTQPVRKVGLAGFTTAVENVPEVKADRRELLASTLAQVASLQTQGTLEEYVTFSRQLQVRPNTAYNPDGKAAAKAQIKWQTDGELVRSGHWRWDEAKAYRRAVAEIVANEVPRYVTRPGTRSVTVERPQGTGAVNMELDGTLVVDAVVPGTLVLPDAEPAEAALVIRMALRRRDDVWVPMCVGIDGLPPGVGSPREVTVKTADGKDVSIFKLFARNP